MAFTIASPAFDNGGTIPRLYTCEGRDISPPLEWTDIPTGTRSLVLIVDDPDAPDPAHPKMTWIHWIVFNLPPDLKGLVEGISQLPSGAQTARNGWNSNAYGGPCPPIGVHRYFFKLYALNDRLTLSAAASKDQIEAQMRDHIIAGTELVGTYGKTGM